MRIAQYRSYRPSADKSFTRSGSSRRKWWRALTLLVVLFGFSCAALWRYAIEEARFEQVRGDFAAGEFGRARVALDGRWLWPGHRSRASAGIQLAAALEQPGPLSAEQKIALAELPFDISPLVAETFQRGRFSSVLRLDELTRGDGDGQTSLYAQAALVELGRDAEVKPASFGALPPELMLRQRLDGYLQNPLGNGVHLRDRDGELLGRIEKGLLQLADGVPREILPRLVAGLPKGQPDAGAFGLTIDREISLAALKSLDRYHGSIVIVDPRSGEILAAVSDPLTFATGGSPAFEQMREPASIAKILTTTAALRAGVDPDHFLHDRVCRGQEYYDGEVLYCPSVAGRLRGLDKAMAVSCNVAFASLGCAIGRRAVLGEYREFGFDQPLGIFESGHVLRRFGNDRQLADLSIGLEETEITPLHAAMLAAVVANDGKMVEPHLVRQLDGRLGLHPRELPAAPGRQVLYPHWLPMIRHAMEAVVERGTANRVSTPGFPVAMKTGTAAEPAGDFHVNYIGYGPLGDNRLAFCVRITDQRSSRHVRSVASIVTGQLLEGLYQIGLRRGWKIEAPPEPGDWTRPGQVLAQLQRGRAGGLGEGNGFGIAAPGDARAR
jgi:peptidoglycan glycosyltransferase